MFNNLRKFLREGVSQNKQSLNSCFCSLITAFVLVSGVVNIARADVCFLPDSEGCEMVPYEEYACTGDDCNQEPAQECKASSYCYETEAEAIAARGVRVTRSRTGSMILTVSVYDSYEKSGDCYCLKNSCGEIFSNIAMYQREGYNLSEAKGDGWNCDQCKDTKSKFHNKYRCTAKECVANSSVSCVTGGDACKTCVDRGYSGDNVCQELQTIAAHCPEGYVSEEPAGGCYSTQDMVCGSGKCYKAVDAPECGEGKRLAKADGVCSCVCETGYHDDNGSCVLNQCTSGVAENTCDTANGYTFTATGTPFKNTNGETVKCGECVKDGSKSDYTPCDNGIWYEGNCVRYFHLRMDSDLHCYKDIWSDDIKVDGNAAHISDLDSDWAVIPEGSTVIADFEMLDQYKDLYSEDVCKSNGMMMRGLNYLTDSELDLNSKLTEFLAQSKISFIADDSHFNYVDTIPWNNNDKDITLRIYDNDYPDSGSSSIPEVTIFVEEEIDGDQGDVYDFSGEYEYTKCGYSLTRYVEEDNDGSLQQLLDAGYSFDLHLNIGTMGYWTGGNHYFENDAYGYYCEYVNTKNRVGCLNNTFGWPCNNWGSSDCQSNPDLCRGCSSGYQCYGSNNFPTDFPSLKSTGTYLEITGPNVSKSLNLGACHHIPSQNVKVCFRTY